MMSISKVESEQTSSSSVIQSEEELPRRRGGSRLIAGMLDEDAKNISRQLVDIEILYLLNFGAKSGYQLKKNLFASFHLNLSYGTLYPHLHSLDEAGLISGTWKFPNEEAPLKKRLYSLTPKGTLKLSNSISALSKISLTMQFMLARLNLNPRPSGAEEAAKIEGAMSGTEEFLVSQGYSVSKGADMHGFSGLEHHVDLYASRLRGDGLTENLVVKIADPDSEVTIDDLFRVYVMSYDLQATKAIMVAARQVKDEYRKLAGFYGITIYSGNDLEEALTKLRSDFTQPQQARPAY